MKTRQHPQHDAASNVPLRPLSPHEGADFAISSSQQTCVMLVIARTFDAEFQIVFSQCWRGAGDRTAVLSGLVALFETIEEGDYPLGDFAGAGLQREVPGLDESDFRIRKIASESLCSRRQEKGIVASPHNQHRRLLFTEIALPGRISRHVGAVVVDEVELYLVL